MSDRARHKSRYFDRATSSHARRTSERPSKSASDDRVIATSPWDSRNRRKTERQEPRRRDASSVNSSRAHVDDSGGDRPRFSNKKDSPGRHIGSKSRWQDTFSLGSPDRSHASRCGSQKRSSAYSKQSHPNPERRVAIPAGSDDRPTRRSSVRRSSESSIATKKTKKSRKRRRTPSSSSSSSSSSSRSSSSSSSSSSDASSSSSSSSSSASSYKRRKTRKKRKKLLAKKMKREEKRRRLKKKKKHKKTENNEKASVKIDKQSLTKVEQDRLLNDINMELADRARAMAPMTKEQWEKKQSVVRRVFDEETGRHRLIKGDGEVLEEIVSRDRHMEINRKATKGDGEYFQSRLRVVK